MAKKFFWSMVLSCASLILVQFIPGGREKQKEVIQIFKTGWQKQQQLHGEEGSYEFRHTMPSNERKIANQNDQALNKAESSKSDMVDEINNALENFTGGDEAKLPDTVVINGVVYPRSPDNIYEIDGQRIMYKPSIHNSAPRETASDEDTRMIKTEAPSGELGINPMQMLRDLQKTKSRLDERDEYLKNLQDEI